MHIAYIYICDISIILIYCAVLVASGDLSKNITRKSIFLFADVAVLVTVWSPIMKCFWICPFCPIHSGAKNVCIGDGTDPGVGSVHP